MPSVSEVEAQQARKLREDFPTFAQLLRIKTKDGSVVPLKLNKAQLKLWYLIRDMERANRPVRIVILKARQLGMSTFVQAYLLWRSITRPGNNGLVVAHQEDAASELFSKIEMMYRLLPEALFNELDSIKNTSRQGKKLGFAGELNTLLYVDTANNPALGRGQTFQHVHLSELAFYAKPEEIMFGLNQSVPNKPGTTIIVESTANGMGNYFHSLWNRAQSEDSGWEPLFLPWTDDDEYRIFEPIKLTKDERRLKSRFKLDDAQLAWRRRTIMDGCDGDEEKFRQENPIDPTEGFLISGRPFFDRRALEFYRKQAKEPLREGSFVVRNGRVEFVDEVDGVWRVWEKPRKGAAYIIGADVSGGTARDFSAAHVLDANALRVVATLRARMDPHELGRHLKWMGLAYNTALVAVEKNGEGRATVLKLINDLHYPNMFFHVTEDAWDGVQHSWGWSTNARTRPTMISQLNELIRERRLKLYCERTLKDLESFVRVDTSKVAEAARGAWDDMVMSLAIACSSEVRSQGASLAEFDAGDYVPSVSSVTGY
jgi:hypothetical protein